jgi:hypothetical protein
MSLHLHYNQYYTHFSFLLFIIGFALPFTSKIKYFILLNSIIIGIVGNVIMIRDYPLWIEMYQQTHPDSDPSSMYLSINVCNFVTHTLPMIVSLLLLPACTSYLSSFSDVLYWTLIELISILLWSLLSYQGIIFETKMNMIYPHTQFLLHCFLLSCLFVFSCIAYFY